VPGVLASVRGKVKYPAPLWTQVAN
ncbi:MAG: GNAT family N-acetyltransferase, partial [Lacticaseibacillus paracasei]